jgi:PDZ domain-containing protein
VISERGWALLRRAFLPVSSAVLVLAGAVVPLPAFVERPGTAASIPACVTIAERPNAGVHGDFLFTTVSQRDATPFGIVFAAAVGDQRVIARGDLLGSARRDLYFERQRQVFLSATERATIVALEATGLPVEMRGSGVGVVDIIPASPAVGVLRPGDVITKVNGEPVRTDLALIDAVVGTDPLRLEILRDGRPLNTTVQPQMREIDGRRRPVVGVRIITHDPEVDLPLSVEISSGHVGGPSAGLMIGLAVYDLVDDTDLAAGRRIAGTGTLDIDGRVGPINSVELKVPAALRQGAQVFLAPASQAEAARSAVPAGSDLQVIGVDTFDDARRVLARTQSDSDVTAELQPSCQFLSGGAGPPRVSRNSDPRSSRPTREARVLSR